MEKGNRNGTRDGHYGYRLNALQNGWPVEEVTSRAPDKVFMNLCLTWNDFVGSWMVEKEEACTSVALPAVAGHNVRRGG